MKTRTLGPKPQRRTAVVEDFTQKISPYEQPVIPLVDGRLDLERYKVLVLNADFRPCGFPLMTLNGQEAISAVYLNRVVPVRMSAFSVRSPSHTIGLPSVVALKEYLAMPGLHGRPSFSRKHLYYRDRGTCMYCGNRVVLNGGTRHTHATIDHVVAKSRGGKGGWNNCVLACLACNITKANKPLEKTNMHLIHHPWVPTSGDLLHLWLTEERLENMQMDWLDFLTLPTSARVAEVLEKITKAG